MRLDRVTAKTLLVQKDLKQKDLVEKTGLTRNTVSAVFCGKSCTQETAERIAKALDVELVEILEK